jgi:4-amino-4-deoxy-L-arabinose transferase-like glycosyltransferase
MDRSWTERFLQDSRTLWIVGAIVAVLFLITNLPWQLDDYDQAKQAFTSFEMVKEGDWLYQRTPHERVATKPPLVGWISAGLFEVTRSWDIAWRLPPFLAAIAISAILFRSAGAAYGRPAGMVALSAFALNLLSPRLATLVRTDMPLALVILLIGLLIWRKIRAGVSWTSRDRLLMFGLLTAGMLIKGPIVYAFLLPGIVLFQVCYRSLGQSPITLHPSRSACGGWWPWIASLAVFLAWAIGGIKFVPGFYDQVVVREFLGRFGETIHRPQPIYFYLPHLLHKFAPWSILMIGLAVVAARLGNTRLRDKLRQISPDIAWLIFWSLGGLLVMSVIPSKRVDRIFPVLPPLCLLLAAQVGSLVGNDKLRPQIYRWAGVAVAFSLVFTGVYSAFKVVSGYRDGRDALVRFGHAVRAEAASHRWHYEAINSSDEGLLLYLEKTHFADRSRALSEWNAGTLDAVVVPVEEAQDFLRDLQNSSSSALHSTRRETERDGYVLLIRQGKGD